MEDNDKVTIYTELFKTHVERYNETRRIMEKANLAFWTLILVGGSYLLNKHCPQPWVVVTISTILLLIHLFGWLIPVQKSLDVDKSIFNDYKKKIHSLLGEPIDFPPVSGTKWIVIQSIITVAFIIIIYMGFCFSNTEAVSVKDSPKIEQNWDINNYY